MGIGSNQMYIGMLNKVTSQSSGKADSMGTHHIYPITLNYQSQLGSELFWIPSLTYSLVPRKTEENAIEETLLIIGSPFGKNWGRVLDWSFGPGIFRYSVTGKGGTYTDPNGNSYYYPNSSATNQLLYLGAGIGYTSGSFRLGLETLCLGCFSNEKRTFALSILFSYQGWGI